MASQGRQYSSHSTRFSIGFLSLLQGVVPYPHSGLVSSRRAHRAPPFGPRERPNLIHWRAQDGFISLSPDVLRPEHKMEAAYERFPAPVYTVVHRPFVCDCGCGKFQHATHRAPKGLQMVFREGAWENANAFCFFLFFSSEVLPH